MSSFKVTKHFPYENYMTRSYGWHQAIFCLTFERPILPTSKKSLTVSRSVTHDFRFCNTSVLSLYSIYSTCLNIKTCALNLSKISLFDTDTTLFGYWWKRRILLFSRCMYLKKTIWHQKVKSVEDIVSIFSKSENTRSLRNAILDVFTRSTKCVFALYIS